MFSYISEGEPSEYGFLPAGVYEGKIVKMEEGISQGAKTRGCPQLAVHIRAFGPEGAATVRYYLTASKDLAWKIDLFVKTSPGTSTNPASRSSSTRRNTSANPATSGSASDWETSPGRTGLIPNSATAKTCWGRTKPGPSWRLRTGQRQGAAERPCLRARRTCRPTTT